jgi:DNA-binding MarR family transcriptional regulator
MTAHSPKQNAQQLLRLSDEVSRIAGTLARLSTAQSAETRTGDQAAREEAPEISIDTVRSLIRARRLRSRFFPDDIFADPAWDILLELFAADILQRRVSISDAAIASAVPPTTALRWLNRLVEAGMLVRHSDPRDARRVFVELTPETSLALRRYFGNIQSITLV